MLYAGPTIPDSEKGMQSALSLNNLAGLAASRPVLGRVRSELGLACPIDAVEEAVDAEQERNTSSIFLAVEWDDREEALKILQRITVLYPRYVAETRRDIARTRLAEMEKQLSACQSRLDRSRDRKHTFLRKHNVVDFHQEQLQLQTDISGLKFARERLQRDDVSLREQVRMLDEHIASLKREHAEEEREARQFEAAEESLADNRRRQHRLRELIQDERLMIEVNAQLVVKRREYERARRLAERQLISQSKLERIRGELESLIAKITENQNIKRWKRELLDLDKLVVPQNKVTKTGSPIIHQILFKKLETTLDILHAERSVLEIDRQLDAKHQRIAQIQQLTTDFSSLEDEVQAADDQRQVALESTTALRSLAAMGPTEFSIVASPTTGEYPARTNRKKLFVFICMAIALALSAAILGYDSMRYGLVPAGVRIAQSGLPVLGELQLSNSFARQAEETGSGGARPDERMRGFALHLRQTLGDAGEVALLTSLQGDQPLRPLLEGLTKCLTARDERVLVIDARPADDGIGELGGFVEAEIIAERFCDFACATDEDVRVPTLTDWLAFRYDELTDVILATRITSVDVILPGVMQTADDVATVRMSQLMQEVRGKYSLVLLLAPATEHSTDLQILASHATGIVFTYRHTDRIDVRSQEMVKTLAGMGAPVIGAVSV